MKFIVAAIFAIYAANTASAVDGPSMFQGPDPQSKFRDAQNHVKELMQTGRYKEASEYMNVYQKLACEAAEQKAGKSIEEGAATCARKHEHGGTSANNLVQQQDSSNPLAPGITVMQRPVPGTSTVLDGSTPSLFVFDPRSDPGTDSRRSDDAKIDPWTGNR
ncbi:MAG TPA: hypothetical protein VJ734_07080 [Nitrosospira sp.]|nr:hypothetical protein [Nitrosospira sp.]